MLSIGDGKYRQIISGLPGVRTRSIYTDGQKKSCKKSLIYIACGSQARAAQVYHDQNLGPSIWFILICHLCLRCLCFVLHYFVSILVLQSS